MNSLAQVVDKTSTMDVGTGALYSIVSILMVFIILLLIIGLTNGVFKVFNLFGKNKKAETPKANVPVNQEVSKSKEILDDDMMVAVLIATIDYRNEIKQDVRLVSVREVK